MPTAMSTFDSGKEGLQDLLNDIQAGKVQLPDFQRGWVWDDEHIRSLLASISLSYPIGAVLMMETGGPDGRFKPRLIEGVRLTNQPEPQRLILDGQQRLTSLYLALRSGLPVPTRDNKSKPLRRWYYLDIEKALDPNADREEAIISLPEDRQLKNFRGEVTADYTDTEKECAAGLFPLGLVYDVVAMNQWQMKYLQIDLNTMAARLERWSQLLQEVTQRIQQYQVPVIELKRETPKEAVCQVFEKVNTGGVTLTVFELLTATFAADGYSLREDWEKHEKQIQHRAPLRKVSNSDFLMAACLLSTWERRQQGSATAVSCKRRDILKMTLADYERVAERLTVGFDQAARFLIRQKIFKPQDVPYQTQIVPLSAILTALGEEAESDTVKQKLARWFWCGVFGELYGSAIESRFAKDLPEVVEWIRGGAEPSTVQESNFAAQRLLGLKTRNSAAYKGLSALLMREGGLDFLTGEPIELQTYFDDNVDIHHIFPQKYCTTQGYAPARFNSVINKTPLSARTNRIIGGNPPSVYLDRLERKGSINPTG